MKSPHRARNRNRLVLRLTLLIIVAGAVLISRTNREQLQEQPNAGRAGNIAVAERSAASAASAASGDRRTGDSRKEQASPETLAVPDTAGTPAEVDPGEDPRVQVGPTSSRQPPVADTADQPGQLDPLGNDVFRSTAGLIYRPGSREGHRLKHILRHSEDDLSRPIHGVFEGNRDRILTWIDIAWQKAQRGGSEVRQQRENDRTAWTVRMDERIGYVGGRTGQRQNHPECRYLRLVLEDGNTVVTAYPVSSF